MQNRVDHRAVAGAGAALLMLALGAAGCSKSNNVEHNEAACDAAALAECPPGSNPALQSGASAECDASDLVMSKSGVVAACLGEGACRVLCQFDAPCACGIDELSEDTLRCTPCQACGDGQCLAPETAADCPQDCGSRCEPGHVRCSGSGRQACSTTGIWEALPCPEGATCAEVGDSAVCERACESGASRCQGVDVQQCVGGAWQTASCPEGRICFEAKDGAVCEPSCDVGASRCQGADIEQCVSRHWQVASCAAGTTCRFEAGAAMCAEECTPGESRCSGSARELCNQTGTFDTLACPADQACFETEKGKAVCVSDCDPDHPTKWYPDADGDQQGDRDATPVETCIRPADTVANADDCDDTKGAIRSGAQEICDGKDNDCDGLIDYEPEAYCPGVDISGLDLTGVNLTDANFSGAKLGGATLKNAKLVRTNFDDAFGATVDFSGSNLQGAQLNDTSLTGAKFVGSSLSGVVAERSAVIGGNFTDANLDGANFSDAELHGASFVGASMASFIGVGTKFNSAKFDGATIDQALMNESSIGETTFDGAIIKTASFLGCTMTAANFGGAIVDNLLLAGCSGVGPSFAGLDAGVIDLEFSTLVSPTFKGATIQNLTLDGVIWTKPIFESAIIKAIFLQGAELSEASFVGSDLTTAVFSLGKLPKADFTNATIDGLFVGVDLSSAKLSGTKFVGSVLTQASFGAADVSTVNWGTARCPDGIKVGNCAGALTPPGCTDDSNEPNNGAATATAYDGEASGVICFDRDVFDLGVLEAGDYDRSAFFDFSNGFMRYALVGETSGFWFSGFLDFPKTVTVNLLTTERYYLHVFGVTEYAPISYAISVDPT